VEVNKLLGNEEQQLYCNYIQSKNSGKMLKWIVKDTVSAEGNLATSINTEGIISLSISYKKLLPTADNMIEMPVSKYN